MQSGKLPLYEPGLDELDYVQLADKMRHCIMLGRNCLNPHNLAAAGFTYVGVGRSAQNIRQLVAAQYHRLKK